MIRTPTPSFKSSTLRLISSLFPLFNLRKLSFSSSSVKAQNMAAVHSSAATAAVHRRQRMKKVVVVMGPTGSGKSKLSIDLATRFFPSSEIINTDKIQIYRGLDLTTNKISMHDRRGVQHHFLGEFDPDTQFTPSQFRSRASKTIAEIISRRNIPILVGGSNSFIHALLAKKYSPDEDVFDESGNGTISSELRYSCCFIWVDVSPPVLNQYLDERVDEMMQSGMLEELSEYFAAAGGGGGGDLVSRTGLRKAIGVPEFEPYFENRKNVDDDVAGMWYEGAVRAIKENTCQLAKRQVGKIVRLRDAGWGLHRVDATEAFRAVMLTSDSGKRASEIWEKMVVEPSVKIVSRFLME